MERGCFIAEKVHKSTYPNIQKIVVFMKKNSVVEKKISDDRQKKCVEQKGSSSFVEKTSLCDSRDKAAKCNCRLLGELQALTPERCWKEISRALMEDHPHVFIDVLRQCQRS